MDTQRVLPGTAIHCKEGEDASAILDGIFSAGGLVLSQVSALSGAEGYLIQNWIRRGFCSPPKGKKYSKSQFCRIVTINLLKDVLTIPEITGLISELNGQLDDESDDLIDDALLYIYFTRTIAANEAQSSEYVKDAAKAVTEDFAEPCPGFREKLVVALAVMAVAFHSSVLKKQAKELASLCFTENADREIKVKTVS